MLNLLDLLSLLDKLDNYAMVIYEKVPIFQELGNEAFGGKGHDMQLTLK